MGTPLMPVFTSPLPLLNHNTGNFFRSRFVRVLFFLILCTIFANIGVWHLNQGALITLTQLKNETRHSKTITLDTLIQHQESSDLNNYHFRAFGKFDYGHSFKIPVKNKMRNGYEFYVPFSIFGSEKLLLVDRGFFSSPPSLHDVAPNFGQQEIHGILSKSFPNIIQIKMLVQSTHQNYYEYVLVENFQSNLENTKSNPNVTLAKKEMMYAMLWFMFSAIFLLMSFLGKRERQS